MYRLHVALELGTVFDTLSRIPARHHLGKELLRHFRRVYRKRGHVNHTALVAERTGINHHHIAMEGIMDNARILGRRRRRNDN